VPGNYHGSVATPAAAAGAAYMTIWAPASTRSRLLEIGLFNNAATASSIGIYRPTNTPVATTTVVPVPADPSDGVGVTLLGTAWSTAPTIGTNVAIRRAVLPAAIGAGIIWQFPNMVFGVAGTGALVIWNFGAGAGSVLNVYCVTDD
jgi:hypothetical protein